jgi:ribosomal protein S12 methylthiotransferase accessory factor
MKMEIYFPANKQVYADYRGFTIKTDQPTMAGGDNTAPAPFDLFLASIGTCAGIYVLSFCQQRNIPTDNIRLVQEFERDPTSHLISRVKIDIQLPADFPEQYKAAVIRSAELCAVKRHLHQPPEFGIITSVGKS